MYSFILLSGGIGSRMNNNVPKQYMLLAGKPVVMHVLEKVAMLDSVSNVIIVCMNEYRKTIVQMIEQYGISIPVRFATAGKTRQESVLSGLKMVDTESVIIHEAARPFVKYEDFQTLINDPDKNAITGIEIPFTVLKGHGIVEGILNRSDLVNVQLPQKFNTSLLLDAHQKAQKEGRLFTEDASLLYYYHPEENIKILRGKDYNIKITTRMDLLMGEIIYDEVFRRRK